MPTLLHVFSHPVHTDVCDHCNVLTDHVTEGEECPKQALDALRAPTGDARAQAQAIMDRWPQWFGSKGMRTNEQLRFMLDLARVLAKKD